MAILSPEQVKLIQDKNLGVLATIREDGTPNVTPVWMEWDGENIVINTSYGRAKDLHLRRDPRCTMLLMDPKDEYGWVSVSGRAIEITEEGAEAHIDKLGMKYEGVPKYPYLVPGERRVTVRIKPEKAFTFAPGNVQVARAKTRLKKRGLHY